jgi:hypothetical protein
MDTFIRGYFYCKKGIRMLGNLPSIIFKDGTTNLKDFMIRRTPDNKFYVQKSNDNTPLANFVYFDWDLVKTVFGENVEFDNIITLVNDNPRIQINTTATNRVGKNFAVRVLNHSGVSTNNGILLQKYNGDSFVSSLFLIDWDTGTVTHYTENDFIVTVYTPQTTAPPPKRGGVYFDDPTSKFKKCEDGVNWINM